MRLDRTGFSLWLIGCLICLCCGSVATAQTADPALERARIAQERVLAQSSFRQAEQDCLKRFVVTPCVDEARRQQRGVLAHLRQQENLLNDQQRKQRAAARVQSLQDKAAQKGGDVNATSSVQTTPAASAAAKPARSGKALTPEQLANFEQERARSESTKNKEAARRAQAQREKLEAAARRKAAVEQRNEEKARSAKPASASLPSPAKTVPLLGRPVPASSSP
jgi:colicin import membrane protein